METGTPGRPSATRRPSASTTPASTPMPCLRRPANAETRSHRHWWTLRSSWSPWRCFGDTPATASQPNRQSTAAVSGNTLSRGRGRFRTKAPPPAMSTGASHPFTAIPSRRTDPLPCFGQFYARPNLTATDLMERIRSRRYGCSGAWIRTPPVLRLGPKAGRRAGAPVGPFAVGGDQPADARPRLPRGTRASVMKQAGLKE